MSNSTVLLALPDILRSDTMNTRERTLAGTGVRAATMACAALLAAGTGLIALPASGQAPQGPVRPPDKASLSKACIAAGTKLTREQQSLDADRAELDRYTKARASCTTKSACARDDDRIAALNKRIPRFETRLKTFQKNQVDACKTS
jgi:hypothetical protein